MPKCFNQIQGNWETMDSRPAGVGDIGFEGNDWLDKEPELMLFENDVDATESKDLLNLSWRSDADEWQR